MSKDQLRIPTFKSLEEFSIWWKTPELIQFRQNNPDKIVPLQQHHLIKPWLSLLSGSRQGEQLKIKSDQPARLADIPGSPERVAKQAVSTQSQKSFGKYLLEKKLGQGGMGAVYLASDPTLQRQVALKVMTVEGQELTERFNREAQAMAKLKHPNIIQVYEVGTIGKYHYFTMEYIQGASLEYLIKDKKNRLSHKQVAEIIRDTASALDYAHKQGIIHRDIKPANIIIDSNRHPYLMDFGLAKELTGLDRSLTMSGSIMGTPDYMSPEQAMGDKKKIDHRSDIFSLGSTLYHCLSGLPPFRGKELYQVLNHVVNKDPIPPSRLIRGLPKDLETICLKCMDKEKARRYQTSKILAEDINRYLEGEPISAKPIGAISKILKKVRKNKLASISIVGAAVILIGLIIGLSVSAVNKKQKIEEFSKQAYAEFNKERYEEAVALCTKLLVLSPEDEEIKSLLRKSQSVIKEKEDKMQVEKEEERAKTEKMQNEKDKRNKAKAVLDRANGAPTPEQKIKIAQEALETDPTFGDAYQVMGYAYKAKDDYDKAVEYFSKAIKVTPTLAYSYYERALITAYTYNKPEEAIPDFEKVFQYDPNSYIGYFAKGNIQYAQKKYDEAIESYTKAIELYPEYDRAYYNRGIAYSDKGELDKAIIDFNEAIRLNPKYAEAYCNCGVVYYNKAERESRLSGINSDIYRELIDKAITDYNEAIRLNPKYALAYTNRGIAYKNKGDLDRALSDYNEAIRLNPKLAKAYNNRGLVYGIKGELDKAITDFNEAIRLNPKFAEAYCNRGSTYKNKGDLDWALSDYNKAIELMPDCSLAYANRSIAYATKGNFKSAIADGEMFLKLMPNHPSAKQMRDSIEQWKKELNNK